VTPEQEEQLISQLPRLFPDYEPVARLGRGAFGAVVAARNRVSGQDVAVKMLGPGHPVADFLREADILGQLSENPHVVRVRYYLERGGQTIIVMERLAGNLVNADLTPADACVVGVAVGHALVAAHGLRILHRDIKPANVLVSEGGIPKVTDFGIAKLFEGTSASATGAAGTYRYMAPEQFSSDRLGPGTDLYALGIMLYELVEGRHPLGLATTAAEWMRAHLDGRPYETSRIPGTVGEVIMSTLAKDRAARPASAAEFVNRLTMAATKDFGRNWLRLSRFRLLPEAIPTDAPVAATLLTSTRRPATASPGLHQSSRPPAVADPGPVVAVSPTQSRLDRFGHATETDRHLLGALSSNATQCAHLSQPRLRRPKRPRRSRFHRARPACGLRSGGTINFFGWRPHCSRSPLLPSCRPSRSSAAHGDSPRRLPRRRNPISGGGHVLCFLLRRMSRQGWSGAVGGTLGLVPGRRFFLDMVYIRHWDELVDHSTDDGRICRNHPRRRDGGL